MIDKILNENRKRLINIRRTIHKNPEMAFKEYKTSEFIAEQLKSLNIEFKTNVAKTGVVGLIQGAEGGKTLLLRADMDALPLEETNTHDFVSQNKGVMHACGHDVHTTILLAAATVLCKLKDTFKGNIKLVFQPAEEATGGALPMIEEGVLENPKVDGAFAFHIWDSIPQGEVMVKYGGVMASPDHFHIKIKGKGGHGAKPEECINPVQIGSEIVCNLQKIKTEQPSVISICAFNSGSFENIIADDGILKGTARTTDPVTRQYVYEQIYDITNKAAQKFGGKCEIDYRFLYPPCVNNDHMVDLFVLTAKKSLGEDKVKIQQKTDMIGEDFAYFAERVPSCFAKLGGALKPLHTADFDVDENAIFTGAKLMCKYALEFLN